MRRSESAGQVLLFSGGSSRTDPKPSSTSTAQPTRVGRRHLVVRFTAFRLERCGYAPDEVVALVDELRSALRLVAVTPEAWVRGLREGMTATEARALVPELVLEPLDTTGEQHDFAALVLAYERLSDRVQPLDSALAVEISRTTSVFGSEPAVLDEARAIADALGHRCRIAIADDARAAWALAEWAPEDRIVPAGKGAEALAPLPIEVLGADPELVDALHAIGVRHVGEWARLDAASVVGRYGPYALRLHRIARGEVVDEPDEPVAADLARRIAEAAPIVETVDLAAPCSTFEPVAFVLPGLVARVAAGLEARDRHAVRIAVRFTLDRRISGGTACRTFRIRVGRPTSHARTLERIIRARLADPKLEAPVLAVSLAVEEACPARATQPGLHDRAAAAEDLADLVARLADALGDEAVFCPVLTASWRPEEAWRTVGIGEARPDAPVVGAELSNGRLDPVAVVDRWDDVGGFPRPSLLEPRSERIEVREDQGRPTSIRFESGWEPVVRRSGPERLVGEWWAEDGGFDRAYWIVDCGGTVSWLYQECAGPREGQWYRHGWFD